MDTNSEKNVSLVRDYFAAFDRGDLREAAGYLSDDVVWRNFAIFDEEELRGREAVLAYWERILSAFPWEQNDHQFVPAGDRVGVLVRIRAKGPKSGVEPPPLVCGYVITLRDQEVVRSEFFPDRANVLNMLASPG
jgi:ketosteroid isomerase-like protein